MESNQQGAISSNEASVEQLAGIEPQKLLSRDDILGITDLKYEVVDVPEWGGRVRVRGLRAVERDEY